MNLLTLIVVSNVKLEQLEKFFVEYFYCIFYCIFVEPGDVDHDQLEVLFIKILIKMPKPCSFCNSVNISVITKI